MFTQMVLLLMCISEKRQFSSCLDSLSSTLLLNKVASVTIAFFKNYPWSWILNVLSQPLQVWQIWEICHWSKFVKYEKFAIGRNLRAAQNSFAHLPTFKPHLWTKFAAPEQSAGKVFSETSWSLHYNEPLEMRQALVFSEEKNRMQHQSEPMSIEVFDSINAISCCALLKLVRNSFCL